MIRNIVVALAGLSALATPLAAQNIAAPKSDPAFMAKLEAALDERPELVMKAYANFQQRQRAVQQAEQEKSIATVRPQLFAKTAFGPTIGNPAGTKTVVEFLDYRCHFCQVSHKAVNTVVGDDKAVRVVVIMRPILGPASETLARFALAADMQGKFAAVHEALYEPERGLDGSDAVLQGVAQKTGLNWAKAKADMTSDAVEKKLAAHAQVAEKLQVNGTPFFLTQKTAIPGAASVEALKGALN